MKLKPEKLRELKELLIDGLKDGELVLRGEDKYDVYISSKRLVHPRDYAVTDHARKYIALHPANTLEETIYSFVHEVLHVMFPEYKEVTIRSLERQVWNDMAPSEKQEVLAMIAKKAVWDE